MALSIGGYHGYVNFEGFDLDSYARGDLEFYLAHRSIIADSLSKGERINAFVAAANVPAAIQRQIYRELEIDEQTIDEMLAAQQPPGDAAALSLDDVEALASIRDLIPATSAPVEEQP